MTACFTRPGTARRRASTKRRLETSWRCAYVSGQRQSRWNMVGTMCVWVMRCFSISASVSAADHPSMRTTPTPASEGLVSEKASGAAW